MRAGRGPSPASLLLGAAAVAATALVAGCSKPEPTPMDVATERMTRSESVLGALARDGWLKPLQVHLANTVAGAGAAAAADPRPLARFEEQVLFLIVTHVSVIVDIDLFNVLICLITTAG